MPWSLPVRRGRAWLLGALCAFSVRAVLAAPMPFPADAGALNVRDFGATGDGVHDDTPAFMAALARTADHAELWHVRIVQVPAGTYRITDTLTKRIAGGGYDSGFVLIGAGESRTVLKLDDHAPGFTDPAHPKAVIYTSGKGVAQAPKNGYALRGEGNDAFSNFIEELTVDTGHDNAGAIGIDYLASNQGALRSVTVQGSGSVGVAMTRAWFGPGLVEAVTVKGFEIGMDVGSLNAGVTLEGVTLEGQRRIGLRNADNLVAAHALIVREPRNGNAVPVVNATAAGMIAIDGATLEGSEGEPVSNQGVLYLRDVRISGGGKVLGHAPVSGVVDGVFQGSNRLSDAAPPWALKGQAEPQVVADPPSAWVNVASFLGASDRGAAVVDATAAFRAAFASGASTLYLPFGIYTVRANLEVPPAVRRIVGMNSTIVWTSAGSDRGADDPTHGLLRTGAGADPLLIEQLVFLCPQGHHVAVEEDGNRTVVLRDIVGMGAEFHRDAQGGPLYLNNISGGFLVRVTGHAPVWGRQVDSEGGGARGGTGSVRIADDGAPMWLLGLKSEGDNTLVSVSHGAVADIVGALFSSLRGASRSLFESSDAHLDATGVEVAWKPTATYQTILSDTRGSEVNSISANRFPPRPQTAGIMVPRVMSAD